MIKTLRPYQQDAINSVKRELSSGCNSQLICMSMGLGKTLTAVKAEEELKSKKTIWLTNDERLMEQSAMAFISDKFDDSFARQVGKIGFIEYCRQGGVMPNSGHKMSIIKADLFDISGDIVFCSSQTLWRRLDKLDPNLFDLMFIDECHEFGSKTGYAGISHFDTRLRLGLSATPFRSDGMMMGDIFDKIVCNYDMKFGIDNGYLCELDAIRIKTNINLDKVHTKMGDFNQQELSNEINTPARNLLIADSYLKYCNGRQGIGFGVNIQHCIDLAESFQQKGINAVAISSNEELTGEKGLPVKMYKEGKIDVLFNVNLLAKGFDHPDTGCTIAAAPTKSLVRYLQGPAGRGSRLKSPEFVSKHGQNCIIMDIVDNTTKHNLVNSWELDRKKPLEERTFTTQEKKDKILEERLARKAKLEHERDKDERVVLLQLPERLIFNSKKMKEAATPAQLKWIKDLGYDTDTINYTKQMCSDILSLEKCSPSEIEYLKSKGYDTTGATKGNYSTVYYQHEIKGKNNFRKIRK